MNYVFFKEKENPTMCSKTECRTQDIERLHIQLQCLYRQDAKDSRIGAELSGVGILPGCGKVQPPPYSQAFSVYSSTGKSSELKPLMRCSLAVRIQIDALWLYFCRYDGRSSTSLYAYAQDQIIALQKFM